MGAIDRQASTDDRQRRALQKLARRAETGTLDGVKVAGEVPTGTVNGINLAFTLASTPRTGTLMLYLNGLLMRADGNDYTLGGATVTFATDWAPETGDVMQAFYTKA